MSSQPDQPKTVDPKKARLALRVSVQNPVFTVDKKVMQRKWSPSHFYSALARWGTSRLFFCLHNIFFFFQAYHSIAKCVAALAMSCPADRQSVVNQFVKDIQVLLMYFANLLFYVFFEVHVMVSQCFSSFLITLVHSVIWVQTTITEFKNNEIIWRASPPFGECCFL